MKPRHNLTAEEKAALAADLALHASLVTKVLMRKYNASRTVIDRVRREVKAKKQNASIQIQVTHENADKLG